MSSTTSSGVATPSNATWQPWSDRVQYMPADLPISAAKIRSASDALVYRQFDERYIITSPNATYIPQLKIGHAQVMVTEDAKLGIFDPILHPQIYAPDSLFLAAIPRPPDSISPQHRLHMIWHFIVDEDVEKVDGTSDVKLKTHLRKSMGIVVDDLLMQCRIAPLSVQKSVPLLRFSNAIADGLLRLGRPAPFRVLIQHVAFVQRNWLLLKGYLTYYVDLQVSCGGVPSLNAPVPRALPLIGTFTNNIDVVETLQRMRIPVWYLRFENQIHSTDLFVEWKGMEPSGWWVRSDLGLFGQLAFKGTLGAEYIFWYGSRWSPQYQDIDTNPLVPGRAPAPYAPGVISTTTHGSVQQASSKTTDSTLVNRTKSRGKHTKGKKPPVSLSKSHYPAKKPAHEGVAGPIIHRSQFDDPVLLVPLHPPRKASWQLAMMACDLQRAHPSTPWKLWCPDPAALLRGEVSRQRNVFWRWLHIRNEWIDHLDQSTVNNTLVEPLRSQSWRDLLMASSSPQDPTTRSAKRREEALDLMKCIPAQQLLDSQDPIHWRNRTIRSCEAISDHELSEMAWEMAEVNFRMELLQIDRVLCSAEVAQRESEIERHRLAAQMFLDNSPVIPTLPDGQVGLMSEHFRQRAPYLEAFRVVMSRWVSCPDTIKCPASLINHSSQSFVEDMESRMLLYYVQVFWETAGRAPQTPLRVPISCP